MSEINTRALLKEIRTGSFIRSCKIPMGYTTGYPVFSVKNGKPVLDIPFLRFKVTGVVDKTLVFPIRYVAAVTLDDRRIVGFTDLSTAPAMKDVDFTRPIGYFRHEAIRALKKDEFKEKQDKLYACYDAMLDALVKGEAPAEAIEGEFQSLLRLLVEPCELPIYKAIAPAFYEKYLA